MGIEMGTQQITEVSVDALQPHEKNPRLDAAAVEDLVESIRVHGIEVPLVAAPVVGGEGYVLLAGHRRLTAAHQLGISVVPVQVREDLQDAREQLAFMATENLHRDQLTPMEESRLFQDMLDLGWTQAEIASATAVKRERVRQGVKLGKLGEETGDRVHRGQVTIDEALAIAEYSDDPDAVSALEDAAGRAGHFDWELSRAKARREARQARARTAKTIRAAGGRVVAEDAEFVPLLELWGEDRFTPEALVTAAAEGMGMAAFSELAVTEHEGCPGHCALALPDGPQWGCDKAAAQHGTATALPPEDDAEESAPNPWDELTAEDFEAARIHREQALAEGLPHADPHEEAAAWLVERVLEIGWTTYVEDAVGIEFLQALTGAKGKTKVGRVLTTWPLSVLAVLAAKTYDLRTSHRFMAEGKRGSSYWGPSSRVRQLLDMVGYEPSPVEERACELATGQPWTAAPSASEQVEGGEQA